MKKDFNELPFNERIKLTKKSIKQELALHEGIYPKNITINTNYLLEIIEQAEKSLEYESIIHAIANIDTIFMKPDGTEREFDENEALKAIDEMVAPIWSRHCEEYRKQLEKDIKF